MSGADQQGKILQPPARVYSLDLLRFLAAAAVVLYHYSYRGATGEYTSFGLPEITAWSKYGFLGVSLFFIISGFVIAWSADKQTLDRFVAARFLRLYPGFIAGLTLTFIASWLVGFGFADTSLAQYFANFIFLPQVLGFEFMDGVYWSIVVELIFYGWIALLVGIGVFRRYLPEIIAIWLIVAMLNEFVFFIDVLRWPLMTPYAGYFAAGMLLFRMNIKRVGGFFEKLMFGIAVGYSMMIESLRGISWGNAFAVEFDRLTLALVTGALFLVFIVFLNLKLSRKTGKRLAILGALSYPLYLIHQHVGYMLLNRLDGAINPWLLFMLVSFAMLAASVLIAKYVEPAGRQFLKPVVERAISLVFRLPWLERRQGPSTG